MPRTPTTRSHGEGSIYRSDSTRRGSGVTVERWIASVDVGVGPNGERLRKKITGPTRKAVAAKLRELRREQDAGVDVRQKPMTVADLVQAWLSHLEREDFFRANSGGRGRWRIGRASNGPPIWSW